MDGRAGMAALVVDGDFNLATLPQKLSDSLPAYARPVFLRMMPRMEITGTFKQRKVELVKDGFDPATIAEPIYWLDPATYRYEPLDAARYADIVSGRVKL
jgi:fatty-acyl-CoA synthase